MLKPGALAVVAEFDPAGLHLERFEQQTPEHYLLIVARQERTAESG